MKLSEAGRMLSKANESKLRDALKALTDILGKLDTDESESKESQVLERKLSEAANLGNWLEARIHLAFTQIADDLFGGGRLTREERIALSGAIGDALDAFNAAVAEAVPGIYTRTPWAEPGEAEMMEAAMEEEFIPLVEQAVRRDGTIPIKVIEPGWGTSGYYPAEVLERDGTAVFPAGTKMFWNHATPTEEAERPEGDLNALAAEFVSDARWDPQGVDGPGLYADAKVFGPYQESIDELAKHIGVSIRASGRAVTGEAEGRKGRIIQQITQGRSVDFVTEPGAGGKILEMFEAARAATPGNATKESKTMSEKKTEERLQALERENARLKEAALLRDAKDMARQQLAEANIPDVTKQRLAAQLAANPPVTEDGELDTESLAERVQEAVKAEVAYLSEAAGYGSGRIESMGSSGAAPEYDATEVEGRIAANFQRLGLSESAAQRAATERR